MGWQDTGLVQVRGYDLCYHRAGTGVPVPLVHGIAAYSFIRRRVAPPLIAAGYSWATMPESWLERMETAGHFIQEDEPKWLAERLIRGGGGRLL